MCSIECISYDILLIKYIYIYIYMSYTLVWYYVLLIMCVRMN